MRTFLLAMSAIFLTVPLVFTQLFTATTILGNEEPKKILCYSVNNVPNSS